MGLLSDLFGAGKKRDADQDAALVALANRVKALEDRPPTSVDQAARDAVDAVAGRVMAIEADIAQAAKDNL